MPGLCLIPTLNQVEGNKKILVSTNPEGRIKESQ
jgi:hypothetical protein